LAAEEEGSEQAGEEGNYEEAAFHRIGKGSDRVGSGQ
jgi:hypothetical protein